MSEPIDHNSHADITCPWCGHVEECSWDYMCDDGILACDACDKRFTWRRTETVTYSTERIGDEHGD